MLTLQSTDGQSPILQNWINAVVRISDEPMILGEWTKPISRLARSLAPYGDAGSLVKVKGDWKYLYRAIDSNGNTIDFLLTENRDATAATKFFLKALGHSDSRNIRVINPDKDKAYPKAIKDLKESGILPDYVKHFRRQILEQYH